MCWHTTYRLRQPKRLATYHAKSEMDTADKYYHKLPKISDLECHIFGLATKIFKIQFEKVCEIIGVACVGFSTAHNENRATVIRLTSAVDRNNLLTAFASYERKEGPLTQRRIDGRSRKRILVLPGPKKITTNVSKGMQQIKINDGLKILLDPESWAAVLHGRNAFPMGTTQRTQRREYGNVIHASKVLCHVL